jgi:hypothetical protein
MKNYTDLELKNELRVRGYEVFDPKEYAIDECMWTIDEAIDAYSEVKKYNFTEYELTHKQLIEILNNTLSSFEVRQFINKVLKENIYENLFED